MDLPNLFSTNSDKDNQVMTIFIHLTDIKIQSFLLSISNEGVRILGKSNVSNYEGVDNCLVRVDESLQQLGRKSEKVSLVIFGLNYAWVKKGEVTEDKNPLLKKLTDDLSLKPMGFIIISEAIVQQKISSNSMFTGIIAVFSEKNLTLSLIHQGKVKAIETVGRSSDGKGDFLEGLARFSAKSEKEGFYLPSKIIMASLDLDEKELKKHQQYIYDSDWAVQTQFLQPPTVTIILQKDYEEMITKEAAKAVALQKGMTKAAMAVIATRDLDVKQPTELDSDELGFSEVNPDQDSELEVATKIIDDAVLESPTSFGVPISTKEFDKELVSGSESNLKEPDFEDDSELAVDDQSYGETKHIFDKNRSHDDVGAKKHYKNFRLYTLVGFIAGLFALLVIGFFGITNSAIAEVGVVLETKSVSKDLEITLDTSISETNSEKLILAAGKISKTGKSESSMQTTGITIVGEKAKGKVFIYNNLVAAEKLLTKGTILSAGDVKFELDDDVTVPAASSPKPGELVPGKIEAFVTATKIGADSNIVENVELLVLPFDKSSYYAVVIDADFIGGSSREVKVVSVEDRIELLTDLKKEIIEEINKEFQDDSGDGVYILPSKNIVSEEASYNFEVGNEAESLSLTLTLEIETIKYTSEDLKPLATKVLASEIPENYKLFDGDPQILSAPTENDLDTLDTTKPVTLSANISSFAIPIISEEKIKGEITGKSIDEARSLLEAKDEIKSAEIIINPSFARLLIRKIPGKLEKIKVEFK
ncbi:hypothetical protein KKD03_03690 [Patescibacteria group bacterium]|nr:hypothetical protein [Patescibacteria group bacterium]